MEKRKLESSGPGIRGSCLPKHNTNHGRRTRTWTNAATGTIADTSPIYYLTV